MNTENLAFLMDNIKYLGFESKLLLVEQLSKYVEEGVKEFQMDAEAFFDEHCKMDATLHFRKSDQSDLYFFNKYEARLTNPDEPDKDRCQTFYVNKGSGITFREAFNLLQGRAVQKELTNQEGEKYIAWVQLNFEERDKHNNYRFRHYYQQYGYELEKTLEKYPIKEIQTEANRTILIRSLQRGNLQPVTFERNGRAEKMFIEANPRYKTINLYNNNMKRTRREGLKQEVGEEASSAQPQRETEPADEMESPKLKREEEGSSPRVRQRIRRV